MAENLVKVFCHSLHIFTFIYSTLVYCWYLVLKEVVRQRQLLGDMSADIRISTAPLKYNSRIPGNGERILQK